MHDLLMGYDAELNVKVCKTVLEEAQEIISCVET